MRNEGTPTITSPANKRYRELLSLHGSRGIRRRGHALVSGLRFVETFLHTAPERCSALIIPAGESNPFERSGIARITLSPSLFRTLDRWGCGSPLLEIAVPPFETCRGNAWPPGCSVILPLQDPKNMGAALRCAAAFGIRSVIITRESVHPYHPDSIRASAAVLPLLTICSVTEPCGSYPWPEPVYALHTQGTPLESVEWPAAFGLIVGTEGPGIPRHMNVSGRISIPMERGVESLNATAAAAVVLYRWRCRAGDREAPD